MVFNINFIILLPIIIILIKTFHVSAELQRISFPVNENETLRFLVVGDWGRRGQENQTLVADQMGAIGASSRVDFVISTGDNFYEDGLTGVDDPNFMESFTNIYTDGSLQKPWFVVLGNHDYRGDVLAQLNQTLTGIDPRWNSFRSFIVHAGAAEFFFIDTTPFVTQYITNPKGDTYDWRDITPLDEYTANLLTDLESALEESTANWKIVVGHHPIRSVGEHGETQELVDRLLPLLQANNVDYYVNGHDHNLQRISDTQSELEFLTSGGGSQAWRGGIKPVDPEVEVLDFLYDGQGFLAVELTSNDVVFAFYDVNGEILHRWSKSQCKNN